MAGCRNLTAPEFQTAVGAFSGSFVRRDQALFVLGCKTGLRISEILSLRLGDVWEGGEIRERVEVLRRNTKGKRAGRIVKLNEVARSYLRAWVEELLRPNPELSLKLPLFPSQRNPRRSIGRWQAWHILKVAFEAAGITGKTGTHTMRKTFAQNMYGLLERDLVKTAKALGHKSIESTYAYLTPSQAEIDQAVDQV